MNTYRKVEIDQQIISKILTIIINMLFQKQEYVEPILKCLKNENPWTDEQDNDVSWLNRLL